VGAAGGIGGFYLPVIMGLARESSGSYQPGFATFGVLAGLAFVVVIALHQRWLAWALPREPAATLDARVVPAE
jgi:NNP family nitrate/nitrite transporter-like MFS transporter